MTLEEKKIFIRDLIYSIGADLMKSAERIPEEWNGLELRQWIADSFEERAVGADFKLGGKRRKDYKNAIIVNNL